ncbi:MAG: PilZ domain-containing protein [Bryobacterales bacterium]|nr:PilZ domain-containing protein [Bryobacterales bacterium]
MTSNSERVSPAPARKAQRRHDRSPVDGKVQLEWTGPDGTHCSVMAKCVDVSETGMKLSVRDRIAPRTVVNFRAAALGLHGSGSVRYCMSHKLEYRVGIEFTGGLTSKG